MPKSGRIRKLHKRTERPLKPADIIPKNALRVMEDQGNTQREYKQSSREYLGNSNMNLDRKYAYQPSPKTSGEDVLGYIRSTEDDNYEHGNYDNEHDRVASQGNEEGEARDQGDEQRDSVRQDEEQGDVRSHESEQGDVRNNDGGQGDDRNYDDDSSYTKTYDNDEDSSDDYGESRRTYPQHYAKKINIYQEPHRREWDDEKPRRRWEDDEEEYHHHEHEHEHNDTEHSSFEHRLTERLLDAILSNHEHTDHHEHVVEHPNLGKQSSFHP